MHKRLETISGMNLNLSQPELSPMKSNVRKQLECKNLNAGLGQERFILYFKDFFVQSASENHHFLRYGPTINNLISNICPKLQVLGSHFLSLMACSMMPQSSLMGI